MNSLSRGFFWALCAAATAGCLHSSPVFEAVRAPATVPPPGAETGPLLLAAGATGADEASDEIVEFYHHEGELRPRRSPRFPGGPPPRREPPRPRARTPMSYHFGVRCGYFTPGEADYDWPDAPYLGLFLRRAPRGPHRLSTEFGGEFVKLVASGGSIFTRMYILHADFLVGRMGARGPSAYAILGGQLIMEEADLYPARDVGALGGGAEIGAGIGFGVGRGEIEIRAVYTEIMSSGRNTEDSFTVSLGYAF